MVDKVKEKMRERGGARIGVGMKEVEEEEEVKEKDEWNSGRWGGGG